MLIFNLLFILQLIDSSPYPGIEDTLNNHLSISHAIHIHKNPGGKKNISEYERENHISIALNLSDAGYNYYKMGDDYRAVEKYREALLHYASGEIYYRYGNSLSNINKFKKAIKAYKIALALNCEKRSRVYYNIACAYSRLKKKEFAFEYLDLAVINGYENLGWIKKDSDLEYLRSTSGWKNWIKEMDISGFTLSNIKGLIAEYLFNGNATDCTGNGNDGTVFGARLTEDRFNKKNSAYRFDGYNDYIILDDTATEANPTFDKGFSQRSISLWFKAHELSDFQVLFEEGGYKNGFNLYVDGSTLWTGACSMYKGWREGRWISKEIEPEKWYHAVSIFDYNNKVLKFYVNGKLVDKKTVPNSISDHNAGDGIGAMVRTIMLHSGPVMGVLKFHFNGIIDDIRVYNRPLLESEINILFHEKDFPDNKPEK